MSGSWRDVAAPIIAEVIQGFGRHRIGTEVELKEVKKAISAEYPFGERKYWPYKVWCDEVRRQLRQPSPLEADPRQVDLF